MGNWSIRNMRILALLLLALPSLAPAASFYLVTGQAAANTTIDSDHLMTWLDSGTSQPCLVSAGNCATFNSIYFAPTFNWDLGGGLFQIKRGVNSDVSITLDLWDVTTLAVGGTPGALTGTNLATVTLAPAAVSTSYTATNFDFSSPATLLAGRKYVATLTSAVGTNGSEQYFIKGIDALNISSSNTGTGGTALAPLDQPSVPEPSTWVSLVGGLGLVFFATRRKSRLA